MKTARWCSLEEAVASIPDGAHITCDLEALSGAYRGWREKALATGLVR